MKSVNGAVALVWLRRFGSQEVSILGAARK
jgi:hypothetical protein